MRVEFEYLSGNTWQPCVVHVPKDTDTSDLMALIETDLNGLSIKFEMIKIK
jgi:hypothetical protein